MDISELLPLTVSVIGHDNHTREAICDTLRQRGFVRVQEAKDYRALSDSFAQEPPHLIVLDLDDHRDHEEELFAQVQRSLSPAESVPYLLLTSEGEPALQRVFGQKIPLADALTKPIATTELVMRVCNLLRLRWQHLQLRQVSLTASPVPCNDKPVLDELNVVKTRLNTLLENLPSGVLVEDEDQRVVLINSEFCRLFSLPDSPADWIGRSCIEITETIKTFFPDPNAFLESEQQLRQQDTLVTNDEIQLADGRSYKRDYVPILRGQRHLGHLWAYRDITPRKRNEERIQAIIKRQAALLHNALDCVITINQSGHVVEWNTAAERTFGYKREKVLGKSLADLIVPHEFREAHTMGIMRQMQTSEGRLLLGRRIEVYAVHARGHQFPVEISLTRLESPDGTQFTAFLRDISERKRFEFELAQALDKAMESARLKSEFLANMSHEIRTPINGVLGMLDLLLETPVTAEQCQLLRTAHTSAESLLTVINDVLDLSKIEAGKLTIEDGVYSPRDAIEDCVLIVAGAAHEKGIELVPYVDPQIPAYIRGDGHRVRQILTNFLSNAVKFTHQGEILACVTLTGPDGLHFSVTDTGIGIRPEVVNSLFKPFIQADGSTTRKFGGTGLGLAISKQLVELMGGEIGLESSPGKGSTFWFTLPLKAANEESKLLSDSSRHEIEMPGSLSKSRVLVVEDNTTSRLLLLKYLESWHIAATGAHNAESALNQLRAAAHLGQPYDFVLLDGQLPGLENCEAYVQSIRAEPLCQNTRILLMTGFSHSTNNEDLFTVALNKPVRPSRLLDALVEICQQLDADALAPILESHPTEHEAGETRKLEPTGEKETDRSLFKVLVADDNAINRDVALRWLKKWGYDASSVTNGEEALHAVQQAAENENPFHLVLMDCQMPELDGYEATRSIRQLTGPVSQVPIVALTAHALEGEKEKCLAAGMDDYLPKPVRPTLLSQMAAKWCGEHNKTANVSPHSPIDHSDSNDSDVIERTKLDELFLYLGEDEVQSIIREFIEKAPDYETPLHDALDVNDFNSLRRKANALEIVALQLGAMTLANACDLLQTCARRNDSWHAGIAMRKVSTALQATCKILQHVASGEKVA